MNGLATLAVILVVILIVWWALSRNAKTHKPDFVVHQHEPEVPVQPFDEPAPAVKEVQAAAVEPEASATPLMPVEAAPAVKEVQAPAVEPEAGATPLMPVEAAPDEPIIEVGEPASAVQASAIAAPQALVISDDLVKLEGIGPKVNAILQQAGIQTFGQLASTDVTRLREILAMNGMHYMEPASWPEQARLAASGKWDELQTLQASLKGGRRV